MTDHVLEAMKKTRECIQTAEIYYGRPFLLTNVTFDLTGRTAGMLCIRNSKKSFVLRFNRVLLEANPSEIINQTVPHEVSHLVAFQQFGFDIKPHGEEWKRVMNDVFGCVPDRCHALDTSISTPTPYIYHCGCEREISVTKRTHNKIKKSSFSCKICKAAVVFIGVREVEAFRPAAASRLLISSVGAPLTDQHVTKVKKLLAGADVGQAILHGQASDAVTVGKLTKHLALRIDQIQFHKATGTIPDQLTHAIFFIDAPTDQQVQAIDKLRSRGARVRVLKHPQKNLPSNA